MRTVTICVLALALAGCGGDEGPKPATFEELQQIMERRCFQCHVEKPTQPGYTETAGNLRLDVRENVELLKKTIYERVAVMKDMPLGNATGMTEAERERVASWYKAQEPGS